MTPACLVTTELARRRNASELFSSERTWLAAAIAGAKAVLALRDGPGLVDHLWSFVGGVPIVNRWTGAGQIPALTAESTAMSRDLKRRGFTFVGPTICYAFMQSAGLVNDHQVDCFRWSEVQAADATA